METAERFFETYHLDKQDLDLLLLESALGTFTLKVNPGPSDCTIYQYQVKDMLGAECIDRLDALLSFLIEHKDTFENAVCALYGMIAYCTFTVTL